MAATETGSKVAQSVLDWLRAGYPDGVPTTDYIPLMALLRRRLTEGELGQVVDLLVESDPERIDREAIRTAIEDVTSDDQPTGEDVHRVAARLAAGGWPLATDLHMSLAQGSSDGGKAAPAVQPHHTLDHVPSHRHPLVHNILDWLRAGYPEGVPDTDYVPLMALLRRRLTDDEIKYVAQEVVADGRPGPSNADIGVLITKLTDELPSEGDVKRVRDRLEAAGWSGDGQAPAAG
jgi:uncharacterized protein (DUF2249 family)